MVNRKPFHNLLDRNGIFLVCVSNINYIFRGLPCLLYFA